MTIYFLIKYQNDSEMCVEINKTRIFPPAAKGYYCLFSFFLFVELVSLNKSVLI